MGIDFVYGFFAGVVATLISQIKRRERAAQEEPKKRPVSHRSVTGSGRESVTLSDYTSPNYGESKLFPGQITQIGEFVSCPACGTSRICPEHGQSTKCRQCGLNMTPYGNSLEIWRDA